MTSDEALAYVVAAAAVLGLPLRRQQAERVAEHLERTAGMAVLLEALDLSADTEIPEIYCPMPFSPASDGRDEL